MFFATKPQTQSFKKVTYMTLTPGNHTLRFLGKPMSIFTHYLPAQKSTVKCLGEDCPICQNNRKLIVEKPETFRNEKGWSTKSYRHLLNVLDRTNVKVCPSCGEEVKKDHTNRYPGMCKCGAAISRDLPETPSNKVKLLNLSDTQAQVIGTVLVGVLDEDENVIDPTTFDLQITVIDSGGKGKTVVPVPLTNQNSPVEVTEDDLYNLEESGCITLSPSELSDTLRGVSLKDIWNARRSHGQSEESKPVDTTELESQISQLFS